MKRSIKIALIFSIVLVKSTSGQFFPPWDIIGGDTCIFDVSCNSIKIDTSQPNNLWQIGKPCKVVIDTAYMGTRVLITDSIIAYDTNNISSFTLQLVHPNTIYYEIIFWHKFETDEGKDGGYLEMSYDMGESWTNIIDIWTYPLLFQYISLENLYNSDDTLYNGKTGFSGSSNGWLKSNIAWHMPIEGKTIDDKVNRDTTLLRFTFISDSIQNNKDGWCIDNLVQLICKNYVHSNTISSNCRNEIFPNPCQDFFSYNILQTPSCVKIINHMGYPVASYKNPDKTLNINGLNEGIYYIIFYTANQIISIERLIKLK